ncbi:MAG: methyltransferase domain-containing protein [Candidatus Omnitrophica bacterium]|nr:methyltransferase domain-containing protein [Candidatus Omnitrophota bacterium]
MTKTAQGLGYNESQKNLSARIEAHKRFSSFSLEDWLETRLPGAKGGLILDIGCGNGNLFPAYLKKLNGGGGIVGVDKSRELLLQARKAAAGFTPLLLQWDMNNRLPFLENTFDRVIAAFSIYYADDAEAVINDIKGVLKPGGEVFLIGPTENNAKELYEFNKKVFGLDYAMDEKAALRSSRLEKEFYPAVKNIFGAAEKEIIPCKLKFPDKSEFIRYYTATLLFEETREKTGIDPSREKIDSVRLGSWDISKEMVVVRGNKHA